MDMNLGPKVKAFMVATVKANPGITTETLGAVAEDHFGNLNASGFQPHQILQMAETTINDAALPALITYERKTTAAKERRADLIMTSRYGEVVIASFYAATYAEAALAAHAFQTSEAGNFQMAETARHSQEGFYNFYVARIK